MHGTSGSEPITCQLLYSNDITLWWLTKHVSINGESEISLLCLKIHERLGVYKVGTYKTFCLAPQTKCWASTPSPRSNYSMLFRVTSDLLLQRQVASTVISVIIWEIALLLEWHTYYTSRMLNWFIDADFGATGIVPLQKIWKPTNWSKCSVINTKKKNHVIIICHHLHHHSFGKSAPLCSSDLFITPPTNPALPFLSAVASLS